jgi:hypothetical protein
MIARREGVVRMEKNLSRRQFKPPSPKLHDVTGAPDDAAVAAELQLSRHSWKNEAARC